ESALSFMVPVSSENLITRIESSRPQPLYSLIPHFSIIPNRLFRPFTANANAPSVANEEFCAKR
ncbi:MAG: hypothetical protein QXM58_02550, partial [Candidatus Micrarchaeaceae archaeon]